MESNIRNFCIIAHIDHGKSTLADRLLELTGTISKRDMRNQILDKMDLEREKGITIKLAPVRMQYKGYQLNLIDTPGHVDFSYEVSKSLEACEGAILVVDATQGIQAQTLANVYLAINADLKIIPVLNKIDLSEIDIKARTEQIVNLLGCKAEEIIKISAKTGEGVEKLLDCLINQIPPPKIDLKNPTRALIFDSYYDDYRGVILYVRLFEGKILKNDQILIIGSKAQGICLETGFLTMELNPQAEISSGEIGYIVTNFKSTSEAKVGDSVTLLNNPATNPLSGFKEVQPFVYAGFFPSSNEQFNSLKKAINKLSLSDSAISYSLENSPILGFGVRIGFLGLLHMDIVKERLEREYGLDLIVTNPSTDYLIRYTSGEVVNIKSAYELKDSTLISEIRERWIKGEIVTPKEYVGEILNLIISKRGLQKNISYINDQALISFNAPLANILIDFYDQLKSITAGFGSFNYEIDDYKVENLVKVDFYIANQKIDSLSIIVHKNEASKVGRETVSKLKEIIPRQNFKVSLQAAIDGKFIAREDISAYRKDVTSGLYGGDVSRKKKVLAKQKKGKARLKNIGGIDLPPSVFTVMIKRN
ncbi:MAG: translation elongation factor 4 [Patescibacteria group bacterium]|nr:translation elongation factor 4 [Patescibacteria group bacterium]